MPPPTQNSLNFCAFCAGGGGHMLQFTPFSHPRSKISGSATEGGMISGCPYSGVPLYPSEWSRGV